MSARDDYPIWDRTASGRAIFLLVERYETAMDEIDRLRALFDDDDMPALG